MISIVSPTQGDVKCLIAYSPVAHMGICLVGFISITKWDVLGSYLMIISHGFFLLVYFV